MSACYCLKGRYKEVMCFFGGLNYIFISLGFSQSSCLLESTNNCLHGIILELLLRSEFLTQPILYSSRSQVLDNGNQCVLRVPAFRGLQRKIERMMLYNHTHFFFSIFLGYNTVIMVSWKFCFEYQIGPIKNQGFTIESNGADFYLTVSLTEAKFLSCLAQKQKQQHLHVHA